MKKAALDFDRILRLPCKRIVVENPVMHKHARALISRGYDQIIQPWQFGHGEIKKTCLWLKGLKKLTPTHIVEGRIPRVHLESPGVVNGLTRKQRRSKTYDGIGDAMGEQWGGNNLKLVLDSH